MTLLVSWGVYGILHATEGNYLQNASFINVGLILLVSIVLVYAYVKSVKFIWTLSIFSLIAIMTSCNYAKSNQQVLVSEDCGMNWKMIKAGDAVPKAGINQCYMKVVIPNFPMQGDSKFIANLKGNVRAATHIDYDYSITNPLEFIKQAKYLGKANADADSDDALNPSAFEGAENSVIDKRIREVAKDIFLIEDIVDLDQSALEDKLLTYANKMLEPLGVHLNFITLTFDLDEQTRQAIDVSTAMKIYDNKSLIDLGKQVILQRAGATKMTVETTTKETDSK